METRMERFKAAARKTMWVLLGVVVAGVVITFLVFNFTYSEGIRAGVLIKFSKKGYVFKTYEGELNLGGMNNIPGTAQANHLWQFSVNDQAVADEIMKLEGRKVSLHYKEKLKAMPWQGETSYFVDGVEPISE